MAKGTNFIRFYKRVEKEIPYHNNYTKVIESDTTIKTEWK